jgi:hypothetical protein
VVAALTAVVATRPVASRPVMPPTPCTATTSRKGQNLVRSATAPASRATVMIANMSWNEPYAKAGMWWPLAPVTLLARLVRPGLSP